MASTSAGYLPTCHFEDSPSATNILGIARFGTSTGVHLDEDVPTVRAHMVDSESEQFTEVWSTGQPAESGEHGGLVYAHDGEYLFCAGHIPASAHYRDASRSAYLEAFALIEETGYPHPFRMWNMVSGINDPSGPEGRNRYMDFCQGRAEAFERSPRLHANLPAATGIGALGGGISFYLLASRTQQPLNIENPRQIPAYRYPRQYGPRSPSFARASLLSSSGIPGQLYVSGTAGIIGHATMHEGHIEAQCDTALRNISLLIGPENLARYGVTARYSLADLRNIKVYVRHREHMPLVRQKCSAVFADHADIRYLNVDICRDDLLVEIEAMVV